MNSDQLVTLCQRHHALLLTSDADMISIAVVGNPAAEMMEALRFATQKRIDIECWTAERMEKHRQLTAQSHLPVVLTPHNTVDILNHTLQQAINQRASDIHIEPMGDICQVRLRIDGVLCPLPPLRRHHHQNQPPHRSLKSAGPTGYCGAPFTAGWSIYD